MTVAESLKRFRSEYGLSQKEVADTVGMVPTSYYRYESGRYLPQADIIITLSKAYGVTTDYLLGLSDVPCPPKLDADTMNMLKTLQAWRDKPTSAQVTA